jgi:ribosomal protein S18 acetylase RimI-like enzyme
MNLRRATPADLPLLVPLFDAYRRFYHQASDPARAEAFLHDRLTGNESVIFLALDGAHPVGFVQLYPTFWSIAACRAWVLNDLYVAPEHRKAGIGRALLDRSRTHAVETGAGGLSLATQRSNFQAQRLYESLGWRRDEEYYYYAMDL